MKFYSNAIYLSAYGMGMTGKASSEKDFSGEQPDWAKKVYSCTGKQKDT